MGWPLVRQLRLLGAHALPRSIVHLDDCVHALIRRDAERELHAGNRHGQSVWRLHRHRPSGVSRGTPAQLRAARALANASSHHTTPFGPPTRRPELVLTPHGWLTIKRLRQSITSSLASAATSRAPSLTAWL